MMFTMYYSPPDYIMKDLEIYLEVSCCVLDDLLLGYFFRRVDDLVHEADLA